MASSPSQLQSGNSCTFCSASLWVWTPSPGDQNSPDYAPIRNTSLSETAHPRSERVCTKGDVLGLLSLLFLKKAFEVEFSQCCCQTATRAMWCTLRILGVPIWPLLEDVPAMAPGETSHQKLAGPFLSFLRFLSHSRNLNQCEVLVHCNALHLPPPVFVQHQPTGWQIHPPRQCSISALCVYNTLSPSVEYRFTESSTPGPKGL